ncbi:acyl-CoA carboxylase epsilon subunit [Streptomyces phaeochromogenes]
MESAPTVIRVERGRGGEEELAALAAVLLALRARERAEPGPRASPECNWWKQPRGYVPPGSWR